jgi:uncharacterized protein (TIGR03000 family)
MLIKNRRGWLGTLFLCLAIIAQASADNVAFAQGAPLTQPRPLPGPNPPYPPSPTFVVPGPDYLGGKNNKPSQWDYNNPVLIQEERPLPINLATALRLANANAWDIGIAAQQIRVASAQLTRADVLWLPTLVGGADYMHHSGTLQNVDGSITSVNKNALELGGSPELVFNLSDAIFEPLVNRQIVKARKADLQTVTNDTTFNVARAYFTIQEARGNLAGTIETIRQTKNVVARIEKMAPSLVPVVEIARARAQLAQIEQVEQSAREQWNVASAEFARIVRLDPSAVVIPIEPPHLQITLVSPDQPLDNLLPVALAARPELISFQALTQAALKRWREEQFRPALPSVYLRGGSNQLPDTMMFGALTGGPSGSFGTFKARTDYELQVMWELQNLGFGNAAAMRQRRAEYDTSRMQAYRIQDLVAREVVEAYALVRSARARVLKAEVELKEALISADLNFKGLGDVSRIGDVIIPVVRPQEAVVAMSALLQAFNHYYGTVGDYNRTQFQLYRALGNPAQLLPMLNPENPECGSNPNPAPPPPASPPPPNAANGSPAIANAPGANAVGGEGERAIATTSAKTFTVPGPTAEPASATMVVRLPENAELYCDGVKMTLKGSERNFLSPPLPPGRTYPYEIRIRWIGADGKPVELSRQVQVQAGQKTTVDFFPTNSK